MLGIILLYLSLAHPNTKEGKKTSAAQTGGWEIICIAAKSSEVTIFATLIPNQFLLNTGLLIRKLCNPPRKTISSKIGTNKTNFSNSSPDGGPLRGSPAISKANQQTGPATSAA